MRARGTRVLYIAIIVSFFLPAITEVPYDQTQTSELVLEVIGATSESFSRIAPLIHLTTFLVLGLILTRRISGRIVDAYFTVVLALIALSNNIALTESFGLVVLTSNFVPMVIVALLWAWETCKPMNDFTLTRGPFWKYWVIPLAVLAFWFPVGQDYGPNFDPALLITSDYGIFFCPTVPVILALLSLAYPRVNHTLLRATSLVGLIVGLFNAMMLFIDPEYTVWLFVLHTPLILISFYCLVISKLDSSGNNGST